MAPMLCSVVISVFNEEDNLDPLYEALARVFADRKERYELIFVDDGSTDRSVRVIEALHQRDPQVRLITLSRNFGHEAAMLAGIDHSRGDAVICMDADLQHPPEKILELLHAFAGGYEVVTMVRTNNEGSSWFGKQLSSLFYRLMNRLVAVRFEPNASDFFLLSRRVADVIRTEFRERSRFLRGLVQSIGFRRTSISFVAPARAFGRSKYSFRALFNLSIDALFSFSNLPLRLGIFAGFLSGGFSLIVLIYSVIMKFLGRAPSGYTTIVALITFLFSVQFVITGIIGEYLGLLFFETKKRPLYIVDAKKFF